VARQTGLGRGLGALIPVQADRFGEGLQEIPLGLIVPNPLQPRKVFSEEALAGLTASIAEVGVLQPVLVRRSGESFVLIAGERRWQAAQRAGLATIPALVQDRDELASLQLAIVENLHREDLNPLEEAAAYQQLIDDFGLTHEAVAERVGKSRVAVTNTLRLLQLPSSLQRLVMEGKLTAGHARALLGTPDRRVQEQLAAQVVREGMSVRQTEELVRARQGGSSPAESGSAPKISPPSPRPAVVVELENLLGETLLTKVAIEMKRGGSGAIRIEFGDLSDLHRIASAIVDPQVQS
jgi:ParB family chromosome partitioning protein